MLLQSTVSDATYELTEFENGLKGYSFQLNAFKKICTHTEIHKNVILVFFFFLLHGPKRANWSSKLKLDSIAIAVAFSCWIVYCF